MARKGRHGATKEPKAWARRCFGGKESQPGEKNPAAVLSQAQVEKLRERRAERASYSQLVEEFGVSKSQVARIVTGTSWATCSQ